jgi:nucleoside-diphosphate-sugar epimerase
MKILLTGATGFLGYRTLEKLIHLPEVEEIIATGRTLVGYRKIEHPKVTYRFGHLEDLLFVNDVTKGVVIIINTASLSSPWGKRNNFVQANIKTQENLIKAAKENKVSRFIYISSPSIYYNGKSRFNVKEDEKLPSKFVNEYARTKFEAEILLKNSGIPFITLRPRALIGRGDSIIMPRLINAFDQDRLKIIGNGKNLVDLTCVSNVADAIVLSIFSNSNSINQTYNITNGEPVNLWENIDFVLSELKKNLKKRNIPFFLVDGVAAIMELKSRLTNQKEPTLTRYGVGTLAKSFTLDISKAKKLLNYQPKMNTHEGIIEFINWYRIHEKN